MPVLTNSKHEQFAQAVAKGVSATKAYVAAGYSDKGAQQSAARLLLNPVVCSRVAEVLAELSAGTITLEISSRNARVQALQNRWDLLRQVITERAAHYLAGGDDEYDKMIPGGTTGLLVKDYKGKDADTPVYKIDTGALSALLSHEKQAAEELGQWSEKRDLSIDGSVALTSITVEFVEAAPVPPAATPETK